jgi:uncharacterized protein
MTDVLIIARSGRALAASAKRAGYDVHVMDCFIDEDTSSLSESVHQLQYQCDGFAAEPVLAQTREIVSNYPEIKIVVGSGFEVNPELLDALSKLAPVVSNSKSTIVSLKDPISLREILDRNSIRSPEVSLTQPVDSNKWLVKKIAGIGGAHVQWLAQEFTVIAADCYYQKYVPGIVSSVVFLAKGTHAEIVGLNQQSQSAQFTDMPFLFQGAVSLNVIDEQHKQRIEDIINKITKQTGLIGLCGIDYIIDAAGEIVVLEVNPRPPSTFELHEHGFALFDAHLACFGEREIDCRLNEGNQCRGYAIYYANQEIQISNKIVWPDWVKDRPSFGSTIAEKFPVCTVHAEDVSTEKVKSVLEKQLDYIETIITSEQHAA